MKEPTLVHKPLPQNPDIWVSVPNYKEPILPVAGGFGWYGLQAYDFQGDKLMCHECGKFFNELSHHLKTHKLSRDEYKDRYGLLRGASLISISLHRKKSECSLKLQEKPGYKEKRAEVLKTARASAKQSNRAKGLKSSYNSIQFQNKNDTCPMQTLRWLQDAAKIHGDDISVSEANAFRPGLVSLTQARFGSFNKAKQICKLQTHQFSEGDALFTKQIILQDMIAFSRKNKRWPKAKDYRNGELVCSLATNSLNGGLRCLIKEAQQLKDEQDKRASIDINAITSKIEMGYAGRARV